jgi:hypothetical protein
MMIFGSFDVDFHFVCKNRNTWNATQTMLLDERSRLLDEFQGERRLLLRLPTNHLHSFVAAKPLPD